MIVLFFENLIGYFACNLSNYFKKDYVLKCTCITLF